MLSILVAEQTQGEVRSAVRSQFDHLSQLHWISDIHTSGTILSVVLQKRWCSRHVWQIFLLTCPLQTWLTAFRRCCEHVLNHIPCQKWFCFLNGVVAKNRTPTKTSCQVRRLTKLTPACLIYLYSFVCSVTRHVPSFVEAWLCYAHGCAFLALLSLQSTKPLGVASNRSILSPGKVTCRESVTCRDNDVWLPDDFRQWRIIFIPAWLPDCPCQGWQ